jgi:hypothetical protein
VGRKFLSSDWLVCGSLVCAFIIIFVLDLFKLVHCEASIKTMTLFIKITSYCAHVCNLGCQTMFILGVFLFFA